ncbi:hypothetical protein GGD61_004955 [Bradyrhizobium sp. SBR1B]|nr:hypothetical protein [Bradyrhizobium sp. SBR1B]
MHIVERRIASLGSRALAASQARVADQSLSLPNRKVATFDAEEAQEVLGQLDCVRLLSGLRSTEIRNAQKRASRRKAKR